MTISDVNVLLEANLKEHIKAFMPAHTLQEAYLYALLPAGKLFRPKLALKVMEYYHAPSSSNICLENPKDNLSLFCSAVEIHHAYTLVHDDLPAMDNDDMRRGKPSTHKKYGHWQAILVGDGLLNISYGLLAQIKHPQSTSVIQLAAKMLGPSGLIHGQVLDLSLEMNSSFDKCRQTHFAKTARLIQFALLGSAILQHPDKMPLRDWKKWLRIGHSLGLLFQFLDDLTELADQQLSSHELEINPWICYWEQTLEETQKHLNLMIQHQDVFKSLELSYYFEAITSTLRNNLENVSRHLSQKEDSLGPVMSRLDVLSQI